MPLPAPQNMLRISEPQPFGDVTLVPRQVSGYSEADLACAMATALMAAEPHSDSEALRVLRKLFPDSPLAARVAALGTLIRH